MFVLSCTKTEGKLIKSMLKEGKGEHYGKEESIMTDNKTVPIWEKSNLTLEEASAYSGIGINKIREFVYGKKLQFCLICRNKNADKTADSLCIHRQSIFNLAIEK